MEEASSSSAGSRAVPINPNMPVSQEALLAQANLEPERLAVLQTQMQEYRQKQMDLLGHFHRAQQELSVQHMQSLYAALQQQQQLQNLQNERSAVNPLLVSQQSSEDQNSGPVAPLSLANSLTNLLSSSNGNISVPQTPTKEHHPPAAPSSNRKCDIPRSNSTTISQLTKDRLKNMIANRSKGESGSQSNLLANNGSSNGGHENGRKLKNSNSQANVSSPHFEPYRLPTSLANAHNLQQASEFQLRKVNSEPNLKMKIRAKLLSKGSSPVQHQNNSQFNFTHPQLKRSDSETSQNVALDFMQSGSQSNLPHLMLPSPSLPNLAAAGAFQGFNLPVGQDLNAFMAVANLSPFLSLPSLLNKKLELGGLTDEGDRNGLMGSSSSSSLASIGLGNHQYQSLLKQQIRDLVLRRKSLVREDPEGEGLAELYNGLLPQAKLQHLQALATEAGLGPRPEPQCTTGLGYDPAMAKHECCCGNSVSHVENGGRIQSIWAKLVEQGHVQKCEKVTAKKASLEQLQLVHSQTYTTFFAVSPTACLKMDSNSLPLKRFLQLPCGGIGVDSDTYFNDASTQTAARLAAGTLIELASQVAEGRLKNGFACIRPPGHHAEHEQAMGFCFFNNVAVTAKVLQTKYPTQCARIAIIDWDVHHGNGTQLSFENDPNVLYLSLHRHDNGNFFPGTGSVTEVGKGNGKGFTVNIPFSGDVMRDAEYLAAWRTVVEPVLGSFQPNFILVSAGFDACHGHPNALGGYEISAEMFGYMTKSLSGYADGKVVLALEGGYDPTSISEAAEQCVQTLIGESDDAGRLSSLALESLPNSSAVETLQKVIAIHKGYWPAMSGQEAAISTTEMQWRNLKLQVQMQSQQQQ